LNGAPGLLLNNHRASSDLDSRPDRRSQSDQIATSKLTIDRQVKERSIAKLSLAFEEESDNPYLLLGQWALGGPAFRRSKQAALASQDRNSNIPW
jgi:hypothetical protein